MTDILLAELFRQAKDRLDIRETAQYYGLDINRHGKACCPFHNDKHPSLSFKRQFFKCFSCGVGGDVFKLVGQLTGVSKPIDVLKIDSLFFDEGPDRNKDMALVEGIIDMVKKFDIRTVAEGIESMDQVEYLKRIGCDYVQGYVFYRPMPQSDYEALLIQEC